MCTGGIAMAMAIAYFSISWLEPAFPLLIWCGAIGCVGALSCAIAANFIKCESCGNRALVFPNTGFEIGNTVAIYDSKICHHCGKGMFS